MLVWRVYREEGEVVQELKAMCRDSASLIEAQGRVHVQWPGSAW